MKWIFCIDDKGGMMFFGRRQSRDRILCEYLLELVGASPLWMSAYSAKLFGDVPAIRADGAYMEKAEEDDYCLVEDGPYDLLRGIEVVLCHWNRHYPADRFLDVALLKKEFQCVQSTEIVGSSHEKITIEHYRRKE